MGGKDNQVVTEAEELPRTIVRRVVKEKLSEISTDGSDVTLHKEALFAFSESARIFIHYLSATANDVCTESKRQIINAEDVLKALEEIEFSEFVEPLRAALVEFKKKTAGKRAGAAKAKEANKKAKTNKETTKEKGEDEENQDNGDEGNEDNGDVGDEGNEDDGDAGNEDNEDDGDAGNEDNEDNGDAGNEDSEDNGDEEEEQASEEQG